MSGPAGEPPGRGVLSPASVQAMTTRQCTASMEAEIAFDAGRAGRQALTIDASYVDARLADLARNEDLARYVL